jgi:hypothetical protein
MYFINILVHNSVVYSVDIFIVTAVWRLKASGETQLCFWRGL